MVWKGSLVLIELVGCIEDGRVEIGLIIEKLDEVFDIL